MFIGHYAVAFAAKRVSPKISLGTFVLSTQFLDLLWPLFLLLGFEHVRIDPGNTAVTPLDFYDYPITHSLVGSIIWSFILGFLYYAMRRETIGASIVALAVFSHWILDFLTHRPDLPLGFDRNTYFGLGLWNSLAGTLVLEIALYIVGVTVYFRTTVARDRFGSYGFWALVVILVVIFLGNIFGPPPPSEFAIAIAGNASWLFVLWAYWTDRHREPLTDRTEQ